MSVHIVFAPKHRRKEIYGKMKKDIGAILRKLWNQKGVEKIEAEACPDHIHMLVSIPPHIKYSTIHGISQGEEQLNDFRQACEFEVQVWVEKFLV